jgi:MFS family permease
VTVDAPGRKRGCAARYLEGQRGYLERIGLEALTLMPGLLIGRPASDRFRRRPVVLPFVVLSPLATLLLVLGPRSLAVVASDGALEGLRSGVVFGSTTAWVRELSPGRGLGARRLALALTAGFGPRRRLLGSGCQHDLNIQAGRPWADAIVVAWQRIDALP